MKHIRPLLVIALLLIMTKANAQVNEFNLSDYKLPDLNYRQLNTSFNLGGGNNTYSYPSGSTDIKTIQNSFSGDFSAFYYHYLNSAKLQREVNAGLEFYSNLNNNKEDGDLVYRNNQLNPSLLYQLTNRMYRDNKFIETDLNVDYEFSKQNIRQIFNLYPYYITIDEKPVSHDFSVIVPLKIGIGRIEQVQDARQAVYIFDELAKINRVSKGQSKEQVIEFAQFISQLNNKRFFDSRLRRMAEMQALDSFLVAHNYVLKSDVGYFSTLLDFWEYGNQVVRNSGNRLSFALYPAFSYYHFNNPGDGYLFDSGESTYNSVSISGGVEYIHEKPVNLFWQNTISVSGNFGLTDIWVNPEGSDKFKEEVPNMQFGYFQTIGYYPDTRTNMKLTGSLQYMQLFDKNDPDPAAIDFSGSGAKAALSFSAYYYVSQKLRLNLNSSLFYIFQSSDNEVSMNFNNINGSAFTMNDYYSFVNSTSGYVKNRFNGIINIGLSYSIF